MKKIICLLKHPYRLMKSSDIGKEKYDNEYENISVYYCKHCHAPLTTEVNFIKKIREVEKVEELEEKISIMDYEGFSINNMYNIIRPNVLDEVDLGTGILILTSDRQLNQIERYGLVQIIKDCFERREGLDLEVAIHRCNYITDVDRICSQFSCNASLNKNNIIIDNVTNYVPQYREISPNVAEEIIGIKYTYVKRYNKSRIWRFLNPRKCQMKDHYTYCDEIEG